MSSEPLVDKAAAGEFRFASAIALLILLAAYHVAFGKFFPTPGGGVGHDYSLALPGMLSGYYWFSTNGLWAVPWYTPAFCGGVPAFADPQAGYYSLLQFATFVVDPLMSAYLTTLVFAGIGYW